MSDRGVPRSYRTMEGFGVHTFRLGVHSLTWEEAQLINGVDPDFHRRDLYDAIESGACPQWELGIQTFPDVPEQTFEGIDLLDPTKIVPEELAPVRAAGPAHPQRQPDQLLRRDRAGPDPRVALLLQEGWRHAKAIGAWGAGRDALAAAGLDPVDAGMVVGDGAAEVLPDMLALMGSHRVWERFAAPA